MSTENRIRQLEELIAGLPTTRKCHCGDKAEISADANSVICLRCMGRVASGTPIHLPVGAVPAETDESACIGIVP